DLPALIRLLPREYVLRERAGTQLVLVDGELLDEFRHVWAHWVILEVDEWVWCAWRDRHDLIDGPICHGDGPVAYTLRPEANGQLSSPGVIILYQRISIEGA